MKRRRPRAGAREVRMRVPDRRPAVWSVVPLAVLALAATARAEEPRKQPGISPPRPGGASEAGPDGPAAVVELRRQQEQLTLENGVADQQLRRELAKAAAEKQRLELANAVAHQRLQAELAAMQAEAERLARQAD